jgi:hypothetical protein
VAEAFLKDQITIGHALLIAKLPRFATAGSIRSRLSRHVDKRRQYPNPDSSAGMQSIFSSAARLQVRRK